MDSTTPGPAPLLSRREFARLASLACVAAACTNTDGPTAPSANGVTINGTTMTVPLASNPTLASTGGIIHVASAQVLVLRTSATEFKALTSQCTHAACTVSEFDGRRLTCPCHGSQFSTSGAVLAGPAQLPLRSYATSFDAVAGVVTVTLV